ncbi:MAG: hypothetical protein HKO57_14140, partial [Akkermansiaceae bacterium]|nr:hypothetical protein [Akkermansiaceae bacterium]
MNALPLCTMKRMTSISARSATAFTLAVLLLAPSLRAQTVTQEINVVTGWNAVWLEVEPTYKAGDLAGGVALAAGDSRIGTAKNAGDVFPAEVVTVLSPKPLAGTAEFFAADPADVTTFNQDSWDVWRRVNPVNDNTLGMITRN